MRERERPAGEEGGREEEEGGDGVGVDDEDMVAHAVERGAFEQGVEANVGALHRHHGRQRHQIPGTVLSPFHLSLSLIVRTHWLF